MKKLFDLFRTPTAQQLADRELASAQRELLSAQSSQEYAARIVDYNLARIKRLSGRAQTV